MNVPKAAAGITRYAGKKFLVLQITQLLTIVVFRVHNSVSTRLVSSEALESWGTQVKVLKRSRSIGVGRRVEEMALKF